jgi:hypothetical protein
MVRQWDVSRISGAVVDGGAFNPDLKASISKRRTVEDRKLAGAVPGAARGVI